TFFFPNGMMTKQICVYSTLAVAIVFSLVHSADHSFVGLMMDRLLPSRRIRSAKSEVPPGPSPVAFSSHTNNAYKFSASVVSLFPLVLAVRQQDTDIASSFR